MAVHLEGKNTLKVRKLQPVELRGPDRYRLTFDAQRYTVRAADGRASFCGAACQPGPKLYVVSADAKLIYVGMTRRPMAGRFQTGWNAKGETGYYGYRWRHTPGDAMLHIWYSPDEAPASVHELETVEAELVYLIRQRHGQWPGGQTEIHFHESSPEHRRAAEQMFEVLAAAHTDKGR